MEKIALYVLGVLSIALLTFGIVQYVRANDYMVLYDKEKTSSQNCLRNYDGLDYRYQKLLNELDIQRKNYELKLSKTKVITVEKIIPKYITLKSGDCNETSSVLDFIRNNHP